MAALGAVCLTFFIVTILSYGYGQKFDSYYTGNSAKKCPQMCDPDKCEAPMKICPAGQVKDRCDCCFICGRTEGQPCDVDVTNDKKGRFDVRSGYVPTHGRCGANLQCEIDADSESPNNVIEAAICVCNDRKPVCGEDKKTYNTKCHFEETMAGRHEKFRIAKSEPCDDAPSIVGAPKDVEIVKGDNAVLTCEVAGYPPPRIDWKLTKSDGQTIFMPSDDSRKSVQARGGPDHFHMTGWLYLTNVDQEDAGVYTCTAKNKLGKATSEARVMVKRSAEL